MSRRNRRTVVRGLALAAALAGLALSARAFVPDEAPAPPAPPAATPKPPPKPKPPKPEAPVRKPARPAETSRGAVPEMVRLPGGSFMMGSPEGEAGRASAEGPQHRVSVRPFSISRTEVTVAEFGRFVAATGYVTEAERSGGCFTVSADGSKFEKRPDARWRTPGFAQDGTHPVVCVSWNDAVAYAGWLSEQTGQRYRLPTEAEWEYAARAGSRQRYFWGDDPDAGCAYANGGDQSLAGRFPRAVNIMHCDDHAVYTAPAGRYQPNGYGLADMLGNVWEWTEDCWHDDYTGAPGDGSAWLGASGGDCARRVLRGGSWSLEPRNLRSAYRYGGLAGGADVNVGIRLARTP